MFQNKDAGFMLNSFLMAKANPQSTETISDIIAEDVSNNDFTNTEKQFKLFFSNLNIYGGLNLGDVSIIIYNGNSLVYNAKLEYHPNVIANSVVVKYDNIQLDNTIPYAISYVPLENNNLVKIRLQIYAGTQYEAYQQK